MTEFWRLVFLMLAGHALADFGLQSDRMSFSKRRDNPAVDTAGLPVWWMWLGAHALMHGGAVAVVTGVWWLGLLETVFHCLIDSFRGPGITPPAWLDQAMHAFCKLAWALIALEVT